jgi:uncharacterized repeat protein (TIGR02543 family)
MPSDPARGGYTFGGWYTEKNGGGNQFYAETAVTGNMTMYAKWTIIQYTVTFNADGGSPVTQAKTVNSGSSVGVSDMPSDPARSGYTFGGWYTEATGGGTLFTASTTVTGNMTVYAKWTIIQYTVTFNADGGSPAGQAKTVNYGNPVGVSEMPADPARANYTFGGWYTATNGGGTLFTASTIVTGNMTVYAKWTIIQYTVTFNADGGSPETRTRTVNSGSSVGVSNMPSNPTLANYSFGGWYTAANGGGSQFAASTTVTGNMTVYAKWTIIQYTVTFNADGGSPATQTKTVNSGASPGSGNMPSNPTRGEYVFSGWFTAKNGGGNQFTASTTVTGSITVYAKWIPPPFPDNLSLDQSLTWIDTYAVEGGAYTVTLKSNETIAPKSLYYSGKNVSITIMGDTTERTVDLSTQGTLFDVDSGVTLTLGNNITLQGRSDNSLYLVRVTGSGTLVMNTGSKLSGNTASAFTSFGGGVNVYGGGTFTMNGGIISGNTASSTSEARGGGVNVYGGTFTMNGGTISGNTASQGGGVYAYSGFTKQSGGTIYGSNASDFLKNTATDGNYYGHAVYVPEGKKRNTTAGEGVTLDSSVSGSEGGWE